MDQNRGSVITITVSGNEPPKASPDSASTDGRVPVTLNVLANDSDFGWSCVDCNLDDKSGERDSGLNPNGTVTYTPNAGFKGMDEYTHVVSDGRGRTDIGNVSIEVK